MSLCRSRLPRCSVSIIDRIDATGKPTLFDAMRVVRVVPGVRRTGPIGVWNLAECMV